MIETAAEISLSARDLCREYGRYVAVDHVNLELHRGEVLGLLGPNGAGKSTTMRMLTGLLAPSSGSIQICGIDLLEQPTAAKAQVGFLPEIPPLYPDLTVDEYLRLAARLHRVPKAEEPAALASAKQRCGLNDCGNRLIGALSKGFQQRVGIAQAIIHKPAVIILDEPSVGLDPNQMREIRQLIRDLGKTSSVILSTHLLSEVVSVCDRVQILHKGQVVFNQSMPEIQQRNIHLESIFTQLTQ
ncbi:MAG: multidrug ABC transporter ATP-binding protein [Proteobacteria bacterium SG_bin4]|nr:MAG: multidrug ABC transporter ATP-binding protein [Proteobacteria bacterium SG_bin4]